MISNLKDMTADYYNNREDFLLQSYDNTWITIAFCSHCGILFKPSTSSNIYKVKNDFYCEKDYIEIQQRHIEKGIIWNGELYWEKVQSPDLQ
jgi:hypothetical protein